MLEWAEALALYLVTVAAVIVGGRLLAAITTRIERHRS